MKTIRVDVFSDIACPFCYIGDTRLDHVLQTYPAINLEWHWHPFQLQPSIPTQGIDWHEFSIKKFGGIEARRAAFAQVLKTGAGEGIEFDFETMPKAPNTQNAHRLVLLASEHGLGKVAALALYKAYFSQARDITQHQELEQIASQIGLDSQLVKNLFSSQRLIKEVTDSQLEAARLGISGVPFFIFNQQFAVSGAQPREIFRQAFDRASQVSTL